MYILKMGKHDRCCVGACNNDKRYRNSVVKRSHVKELKWHKVPSNPTKKSAWIKLIGKGRACFSSGNWTYVCSNHFIDGEPTAENPNPALFLTQSEVSQSTPKKRRPIRQRNPAPEEPKTVFCDYKGMYVADCVQVFITVTHSVVKIKI